MRFAIVGALVGLILVGAASASTHPTAASGTVQPNVTCNACSN